MNQNILQPSTSINLNNIKPTSSIFTHDKKGQIDIYSSQPLRWQVTGGNLRLKVGEKERKGQLNYTTLDSAHHDSY